MGNKYHCLFEQSGHFKNEFKKLGYEAYDYDILNDFNETDFQIDLFKEIEQAFDNEKSIFDTFSCEDICLAFFPCTRFEDQIQLWYRGENYAQRNWNEEEKIVYAMKLHEELNHNYMLFSKMILICLRKKIKIIIENPISPTHYLKLFFPIKPKIIDKNRHESGDFFKKPTQYWFINIEPKNNFIFEPVLIKNKKTVENTHNVVERSLISTDYVNRFIREFIIEEKKVDDIYEELFLK